MLSKTDAVKLLRKHLKSSEARKHSLAVAELMARFAGRLKMNSEEWELCGLLHDLDHEEVRGDMSKHGLATAELLEGRLPRDCLQAIRAHDHRTGVVPRSIIDKALVASDAMSRFFSEMAEREESGELAVMDSGAFRRKFEEKPFKKLDYLKSRIEICREIGVPLDDFLNLAREVMLKKAAETSG
jgi:putative nucleotidyltransferase with HDIG domain